MLFEGHMPRASHLNSRLRAEPQWVEQLLQLPAPSLILSTISERVQSNSGITARELGELLHVRDDVLRKQIHTRRLQHTPDSTTKIPQDSALRAVKGYLPRILGWKSVADFAEELGIHRNTVQSIIQLAGKKEALRYSLDQRLYISPGGEEFVRERKQFLDSLESREKLSDFAKRMRIKLNHLTAFFSARGIPLDADIRGLARLTNEQKEQFLSWRDEVLERRKHRDMVIDGQTYKSIVRMAEEKADLFAPRGTTRYRKLKEREIGSFRHSSRKGGFGAKTDRGTYIPEDKAVLLFSSLTITEAARLLGVSVPSIKNWALHHPEIVTPHVPGKRTRGISLPPLLNLAHAKFDSELHLSSRETVPTIIASSAVHHIAKQMGSSLSRVLRLLPIDKGAHAALEARVGSIPRSLSQQVTSLLRDVPLAVDTRPLTSDILASFTANAGRIDIPPQQLLALALSPALAERCSALPLEIPAPLYLNLIRLGSANASNFDKHPIVPAAHLSAILIDWSKREGISLKTALSLARVEDSERARITTRDGFVSGATARRLLSFSRMSAEEYHKATSISEHRFRSVIKERAANLGVSWRDLVVALPIDGRSTKSLLQKEGAISGEGIDTLKQLLAVQGDEFLSSLQLQSPLFSVSSLQKMMERVASARNVTPERIYSFVRSFFSNISQTPTTYLELLRRAQDPKAPAIFPVKVGVLLNMISSRTTRVHTHGVSTFTPDVGDIFMHPGMKDFGPIVAIENTEGGRTARVALVERKTTLGFRIP